MTKTRRGLLVIVAGLVACALAVIGGILWYDHRNIETLHELGRRCWDYPSAAEAYAALAPTLPPRFSMKGYDLSVEITYQGVFLRAMSMPMFPEPPLP